MPEYYTTRRVYLQRNNGKSTGSVLASPAHHEKKAKKASASLCEVNGHQWVNTPSDKAQRCSRSGCKIVRLLIRGHWKNFTFARSTSHQEVMGVLETQEQLSLWEQEDNA